MSDYKFKSKDFYALLNKQEYKCRYSGRELTPQNTQAVHELPLAQGGKHSLSNIVLVDKDIYHFKKYLSHKQLLNLGVDIIKFYGKENGYRISKSKK